MLFIWLNVQTAQRNVYVDLHIVLYSFSIISNILLLVTFVNFPEFRKVFSFLLFLSLLSCFCLLLSSSLSVFLFFFRSFFFFLTCVRCHIKFPTYLILVVTLLVLVRSLSVAIPLVAQREKHICHNEYELATMADPTCAATGLLLMNRFYLYDNSSLLSDNLFIFLNCKVVTTYVLYSGSFYATALLVSIALTLTFKM